MKLDKYFHLYGRKDDVVFEEIPAPVEIVRCWECKWWELGPDNTMLPDWHKCRFYGTRMHTRDNDFCSKGERRE